jgi:hypothetical protein
MELSGIYRFRKQFFKIPCIFVSILEPGVNLSFIYIRMATPGDALVEDKKIFCTS